MSLETIEREGFTATLENDADAESPRTAWDNLGTMACYHRRYTLGDKVREYDDPKELVAWLDKVGAIRINLYLYDHGGLCISGESFVGRAAHADWDSGRVGVIYATKEAIRKEYGCKRITKKIVDQVLGVLHGEIETYDQYIKGDVYGYTITDENGDHVDSCWGFFGYEYAKQEALGALNNAVESAQREDSAAASYMAL